MIANQILFVLALTFAAQLVGCGKSGSTGGGASDVSPLEAEARDTALAEVGKHWAKGPDGWTTARESGTSFAPVRFLRQAREIKVRGVQASELTSSDKLNGVEWDGEVYFEDTAVREAGEPGLLLDGMVGLNATRQRGRWSQWVDFKPEAIRLQKVKGQWQPQTDTWLLRGTMPGPADYTNAGVSPRSS